MLGGKNENDTLRQTASVHMALERATSGPVASMRRGGFAGNLARMILVVLATALALSMMPGWGMSAFADEPSGSAQEATTENTGADNTDNVSVGNTSGADNAGIADTADTADSGALAKEARNDLFLPTVIAIIGLVILCIALILLIIVWRRNRRNRNK
jgi:hypothetical protein